MTVFLQMATYRQMFVIDIHFWYEKFQRHFYEYYTVYSNAVVCSRVSRKKIDEILYE